LRGPLRHFLIYLWLGLSNDKYPYYYSGSVTVITSFEYCSLHYLNQWLSYDMGYCQALTNGNKEEKLIALKKAGGFYRISRNLPSEYDEKKGLARYEIVLDIIDKLESAHFEKNPVKEILAAEEKISERYGNRKTLSLTTKFLWIKVKQPILIYDSQARIALGVRDRDLEAYYDQWSKSFRKDQAKITEVCSKLPDM
ncbi:MAG: hypothetical protein ABTR07_12645, partial [Candidatus Competibacter denitrificans]